MPVVFFLISCNDLLEPLIKTEAEEEDNGLFPL